MTEKQVNNPRNLAWAASHHAGRQVMQGCHNSPQIAHQYAAPGTPQKICKSSGKSRIQKVEDIGIRACPVNEATTWINQDPPQTISRRTGTTKSPTCAFLGTRHSAHKLVRTDRTNALNFVSPWSSRSLNTVVNNRLNKASNRQKNAKTYINIFVM